MVGRGSTWCREPVTEYTAPAVMIAATFALPVAARHVCGRYVPVWSLILVAAALNVVSLFNVIDGPLPGAQWDAQSFHEASAKLADNDQWPVLSIGTEAYKYVLAATYRLLGDHKMVGQTVSVLASIGSLIMMAAICRVLGIDRDRLTAWIVLLCGLYPTFVYHGALTFREPLEILGLTLGTWGFLRMCRDRRLRWLFAATGGFLLMGLFHHVLMGIALVLVTWGVLCVYSPGGRHAGPAMGRNALVAATLVAVTVVSGYLVITVVPATSRNDYIADIRRADGILEAVVEYRREVESGNPRTSFDPGIEPDSTVEAVKGLAGNYVSYLFKPYATDIEYRMDLVPFSSSLGRALLIGVIVVWLVSRRSGDGAVVFLIGAYLAVTCVWSLGTTNYGQAFRHHAMTDWILIILCGYALSREWKRRHEDHAAGVGAARLE